MMSKPSPPFQVQFRGHLQQEVSLIAFSSVLPQHFAFAPSVTFYLDLLLLMCISYHRYSIPTGRGLHLAPPWAEFRARTTIRYHGICPGQRNAYGIGQWTSVVTFASVQKETKKKTTDRHEEEALRDRRKRRAGCLFLTFGFLSCLLSAALRYSIPFTSSLTIIEEVFN